MGLGRGSGLATNGRLAKASYIQRLADQSPSRARAVVQAVAEKEVERYYRKSPCQCVGHCGGACGGGEAGGGCGGGSFGAAVPPSNEVIGTIEPEPQEEVTGTVQPLPPSLPADGWPSAPAFRPGNWEGSIYTIAEGDTLAGLARLYMGAPQRWREIWTPNAGKYGSPDRIPQGGKLIMPSAAVKGMKALLGDPSATRTPASPGAPGAVPGAVDPGTAPAGSMSLGKKVAIGAGVVVGVGALGTVIYLVSR